MDSLELIIVFARLGPHFCLILLYNSPANLIPIVVCELCR